MSARIKLKALRSEPGGIDPTPPDGESPALELNAITAGYGTTEVLRDVTVSVRSGQVVAIFGPNGAGKTTLLRVASGVIVPMSGFIKLNGRDVTLDSVVQRTRQGLCDIPEGRGIFPSLSVRDNIILQSPRGREAEALELTAESFPALKSRMKQVAGSLSGGEQQMLAIARAFVTNPGMVVVDEVSLGLAPLVIDRIFETLAEIASRGTALLIVEQYVSRALALAEYVYVLNRGSVVFSSDAANVQPDDIFETYLNIDVTSAQA